MSLLGSDGWRWSLQRWRGRDLHDRQLHARYWSTHRPVHANLLSRSPAINTYAHVTSFGGKRDQSGKPTYVHRLAYHAKATLHCTRQENFKKVLTRSTPGWKTCLHDELIQIMFLYFFMYRQLLCHGQFVKPTWKGRKTLKYNWVLTVVIITYTILFVHFKGHAAMITIMMMMMMD